MDESNLGTVGEPGSCERTVNQLNKLPVCSSAYRFSLHCRGKLKTSCKGALNLCLTLTLSLTACQEKPPSPDTEQAEEKPTPEREEVISKEVISEEITPIVEVAPTPEAPRPPLNLTLPPDLEQDFSPLTWDEDQLRLPNLFESRTKSPSRVSGKLLLHETRQEDTLDNVSGAQVEVNIPVE